jgi:F-type H+-transporting ATPase subunit b
MFLAANPVSISVSTLVVEVVIFLLMVWAMESLVFNPIRTAWAERDRRIQEGLEASTESRDEAEHARQEVERTLLEARRQAQSDIDAATQAGDRARDELVAQATAEFRRLVDAARVDIGAERDRTAQALPDRIVDLALLAASHVTGQTYSEQRVRELAATVVSREGLI